MKKLITKFLGVLLILLTLFYTFMGCVNNGNNTDVVEGENNDLEYGFIGSGGIQRMEVGAYKCDKSVFDIDDVTITFCYGFVFSETIDKALEISSYPDGFDICFIDENENIMFYRHDAENFISEKNKIKTVYNENDGTLKFEFNRFEKITIPKEMFIKNSGVIRFVLEGINVKGSNLEKTAFIGLIIYYIKKGNQVVLYDDYYSWNEEVENEN